MFAYIVKRILAIFPILLGASFLVFSMVYMIPGDPAQIILGQGATEEAIESMRAELGLNEPFIAQYGIWLFGVLQGDLGMSIAMRIPVTDFLFPKLINTLILTGGALAICLLGGVLVGVVAALRKYTLFDRIAMFIAQFGANTPVFWLAILLMWLFSLQLGWFPTIGMYDYREGFSVIGLLEHLLLPAFATACVSLAVIARLTRSSMIDVLNKEFMQTFRANGISESRIVAKHGFRNILAPLLNMTGLQIGYLLGGAIFVEVVFSWPGIGSQLFTSINAQDIPMIQAGILFIAITFVVINLIMDIVVTTLNPRMRQ
ncbi:dipeptide transport system permease protein DppB [Geomicrobium sp. JCM 19037]|uniref:ABC transporter permease n=1 Tax=Geomicrobium sp. JCM 19037 TaxID=1460634 RepID=UPI00045F38B1|nr:ABC transporter permease [Geomicrobium sp. JCM 19037]GAK04387.1 dipeptide transport system permease protein DppB [Geomicrobium sp. JCM 19037]